MATRALPTAVITSYANDRAGLVLLVSGTIGFVLGLRTAPELQTAVEGAQIIAGVVQYPSLTPALIMHAGAWSLLPQALAALLAFGVSELQLSWLMSAALGAVSLQALSLFIYAFSGDAALALLGGFVIAVSRTAEFGSAYPILLLGGPSADSSIGLSAAVLAVGLLACGRRRSGALLFGLLPAVHPPIGIWMALVFAASMAWERLIQARDLGPIVRSFVLGAGFAGVSFLVHHAFVVRWPAATADPGFLTKYVDTWDVYRQPVPVFSDGMYLNAAALVLGCTWLTAFRDDLTRAATVGVKIVVLTAVCALCLAATTWVSPDAVPSALLAAMPGRLLNVNAMLAVALVIGLIGAYRQERWSGWLSVAVLIGLLGVNRSLAWRWFDEGREPEWAAAIDPWWIIQGAILALVVCTLHTWNRRTDSMSQEASVELFRRPLPMQLRAAYTAVLIVTVAAAWPLWRDGRRIADWTTDPLYRVAAGGNGILLQGASLRWIQLRTRRPLLMDGDLTALPCALDAAPGLIRVLKDVYGVDFYNPPDEARHASSIPEQRNKIAWEGYSAEDWQRVRREFHVVDVLTTADWSLDLPVAAQSRGLRLYHIPE